MMTAVDVFCAADLSRVAIIGSPGSGKSTLALELSQLLKRNVVHLDRVMWRSGWQLPSKEECKAIHDGLIAEECWIIDGMWGSLVADRFARATMVIFLDVNRLTCLRRAFFRSLKYRNKPRVDMAEGCRERLDRDFVSRIWGFPQNMRPRLLTLAEDNPQVTFIVIKGVAACKRFVKGIKNNLLNAKKD